MVYRQTKQREEVLQIVQGVNKHMTAEEVFQEISKNNPNMGIATVYRNLNRLVEMNIIARIVDKEICYYDGNSVPHYHLHCAQCGKFQDAPVQYNKQLDTDLEKQLGIEILGHNVTFECICEECTKKTKKN
ncbi:Fur family transcriptional regulator [Anaerorhabdus sp.]|jgi:Fe2+ or Zn2+ uptake regulation protein|uniref:Fur family transcriptional regulator n=1 Tax=Anaerorhabdus sp. TaxID=1872524 RepID=UPI002FCBF6A7